MSLENKTKEELEEIRRQGFEASMELDKREQPLSYFINSEIGKYRFIYKLYNRLDIEVVEVETGNIVAEFFTDINNFHKMPF